MYQSTGTTLHVLIASYYTPNPTEPPFQAVTTRPWAIPGNPVGAFGLIPLCAFSPPRAPQNRGRNGFQTLTTGLRPPHTLAKRVVGAGVERGGHTCSTNSTTNPPRNMDRIVIIY